MRTEQNRAEAVLCSTTGGPIMALKNFNWKILTAIGLLAGLIQVAAGVAMYLAGVYFASWSMFPSLLVLLLCIVFGTRWYRDAVLKGHITYGQALIVGIVISVSTGLFTRFTTSSQFHFLSAVFGGSDQCQPGHGATKPTSSGIHRYNA
jgi:hypothetical protein